MFRQTNWSENVQCLTIISSTDMVLCINKYVYTYMCCCVRFFNRLYSEYQKLFEVKKLQLEADNPEYEEALLELVKFVFNQDNYFHGVMCTEYNLRCLFPSQYISM